MRNSRPRKSAMESALDSLSRRALSIYELETRLEEKDYDSSEIKAVLEKIIEWGYLNDQELALMYSESRLKRYSKRRVQKDMLNRGIEPELVEKALQVTYSSDNEFQQCLALAERWYEQEGKRWEQRRTSGDSKKAIPRELWIRQKVIRKLMQRGYSTEMAQDTLSKIGKND